MKTWTKTWTKTEMRNLANRIRKSHKEGTRICIGRGEEGDFFLSDGYMLFRVREDQAVAFLPYIEGLYPYFLTLARGYGTEITSAGADGGPGGLLGTMGRLQGIINKAPSFYFPQHALYPSLWITHKGKEYGILPVLGDGYGLETIMRDYFHLLPTRKKGEPYFLHNVVTTPSGWTLPIITFWKDGGEKGEKGGFDLLMALSTNVTKKAVEGWGISLGEKGEEK